MTSIDLTFADTAPPVVTIRDSDTGEELLVTKMELIWDVQKRGPAQPHGIIYRLIPDADGNPQINELGDGPLDEIKSVVVKHINGVRVA